MADRYQLFINGEFVDAQNGGSIPIINPATGEQFAAVADGQAVDIDRAVEAAHAAFPSWSSKHMSSRGKLLYKLAQLVDRDRQQLAELETRNVGKPIRDTTRIDLYTAVDALEYFAGFGGKLRGETIPVPGRFLNYTVREPYGVVGGIIPWNYPLLQAIWKIAPAIMAGNTVVLKPAEQAPLTPLELARLSAEAGFPEGVINVVPGYGETAGAALVQHPLVRKIGFTGSTAVGREIGKAAAAHVKPVTLELGGKSPNIIFADADLRSAIPIAASAIFANMGEVCTAGSRLLVEESVHETVIQQLIERTKRIVVGDPMDPDTTMGPIVTEEQFQRVNSYIKAGFDEGAQAAYQWHGEVNPRGYFVGPVIFDNVSNNFRIAREEIFGPVLSVIPFKSEEEAVAIANDTEFGLGAGIHTTNIGRALRMASAVRAGNVWVNSYGNVHSASPYGGYLQSGHGREMGFSVMEEYTQVKSVWVSQR